MSTKKVLYLGEHDSGKTHKLFQFFDQATKKGISSEQIAIVVRNRTKEQRLKNYIREIIDKPFPVINVWRFRSLVAKAISSYWSYKFAFPPHLLGFSESIITLREFLKLREGFFGDIKIERSFLIRMYERQQRRAELQLSFTQIHNIGEEVYISELSQKVDQFLEDYSRWLRHREKPLLDYALQLEVFQELWEIDAFTDNLAKMGSYAWLIDDIDDAIPVEQKFYEKLSEKVENIIYAGNSWGGFRQLMGSHPDYITELEKKVHVIEHLYLENPSPNYYLGEAFYQFREQQTINHELVKKSIFEFIPRTSYSQMLDVLKGLLQILKAENYKPGDIALILGRPDEQLAWEINFQASQIGWKTEIIRGAQVLFKNPVIRSWVTLLRMVFDFEGRIHNISAMDFSQLLSVIGGLDNYYLAKLRHSLGDVPENWTKFINDYSQKEGFQTLKNLFQTIEEAKVMKESLKSPSDYRKIAVFLWEKLLWKTPTFEQSLSLSELNTFLEMLFNHLKLYQEVFFATEGMETFLELVLRGELSDSPDREINSQPDKLLVIPWQKLIENQINTPIQIWIDISSSYWKRAEAESPLSPSILGFFISPKHQWSMIEEEDWMEDRLAKNFKYALSLAGEKAYFISSDFDIMGQTQSFDFFKSFFLAIESSANK